MPDDATSTAKATYAPNGSRRRNTLFRKASELHQSYHYEVVLLVKSRKGQYYVFTSETDMAWRSYSELVIILLFEFVLD